MLAAVARKDYETAADALLQGIAKAKAQGSYRGRPENTDRNAGHRRNAARRRVVERHPEGHRLSRATINKVARRMVAAAE